ncbi:hypothetical protein DNFV4_03185 [Nitrospira tepida]|uniref:Uncharacterized protein n=1 Tax=Nitrospira tepida TaxID=2973512 RepID=A0AA86N0Y5_9BACT|nr:hypothetical protein [Nitrospira tepida]CAI4032755.1 hypothetical protein DNFV4_03185 [Nitrospira tepida]
MSNSEPLYAVRYPDGSVSLYVDEEYALDQGIDPAKLVRVDVPRELYSTGTVQEIREYVATYIESLASGSA